MFEPWTGQRQVRITDRHTMQEFAHCMKWLVDIVHPEAEVIRVILDNLKTHKPAVLYLIFPPSEALRFLKKLEFHYTSKHASMLNMAEIELSVFDRRLKAFIPDDDVLFIKVNAMVDMRIYSTAKLD